MKPGDLVKLDDPKRSPLTPLLGVLLEICPWGNNGDWVNVWWPGLDTCYSYRTRELEVISESW